MSNHFKNIAVAGSVAIATLLLSATVSAQDVNQWNRQKGDCEYVLKAPDRYPLPSVQECTMKWEQYRDVTGLSPDEKNLYARGFSWLFLYGDTNQKALAKGALARIGRDALCFEGGNWRDCRVDPKGRKPTVNIDEQIKPLPKVAVRSVSKGKEKKASRLNTKGFKKYKRKSYTAAIDFFEKALDIYPHYVTAKYNLACNQSLAGDADGTIRTLLELQSWDSPAAQSAFARSRIDKDFAPMHGDERFRRLVGLIRIQLLNGAADAGLYHVGQIYKKFKQRKMPIAQYGYDRHIRERPYIWYREGYEAQAALAKEIVAHHRTAVTKITWDSPFDIIISYGDPDVAEKVGIGGPIVQGEPTKGDGSGPGDLLEGVKGVKDSATDVKDTADDTAELPADQ